LRHHDVTALRPATEHAQQTGAQSSGSVQGLPGAPDLHMNASSPLAQPGELPAVAMPAFCGRVIGADVHAATGAGPSKGGDSRTLPPHAATARTTTQEQEEMKWKRMEVSEGKRPTGVRRNEDAPAAIGVPPARARANRRVRRAFRGETSVAGGTLGPELALALRQAVASASFAIVTARLDGRAPEAQRQRAPRIDSHRALLARRNDP
jgi:hypothetical protein